MNPWLIFLKLREMTATAASRTGPTICVYRERSLSQWALKSELAIKPRLLGVLMGEAVREAAAVGICQLEWQPASLQPEILSYTPPLTSDATRAMLRHLVATLAYRAAKVLRDVPLEFAEFWSGTEYTLARSDTGAHGGSHDVGRTVGSRRVRLERRWQPRLEHRVATFLRPSGRFGQGACVRSSSGFTQRRTVDSGAPRRCADTRRTDRTASRRSRVPVHPESYARAEIVAGHVGREQAAPGREFDGDASPLKP